MNPNSQLFQISSLPRSGSAWLATALNLSPDILAFHESACECDLKEVAEKNPSRYVGDVSTMAPWQFLGDVKRFCILRHSDDARKAAAVALGKKITNEEWRFTTDAFYEWMYKYDVESVMMQYLFTPETVRHIMGVVAPGATIDQAKLKLLCNMNVQKENLDYDIETVLHNLEKSIV